MAKILVIDDDRDFIKITRMILQSKGYDVITAANGEEGLKVMRREKPDLVILDIMMAYILEGLDIRRQMAADPEPQRHSGHHVHFIDRGAGAAEPAV